MYFFGKIIGVFLGFKWGGFFGAIAGLILGSIADKKLYELGSVNSSFFKKKTTRQALFMQTTFAVLGHLSKSKGRVTEEDIQLANQLMNQMQLDESHRKLAQEAFRRGKEADLPKVDSIANTNKAAINSKVVTNTNNKADTNNLQALH